MQHLKHACATKRYAYAINPHSWHQKKRKTGHKATCAMKNIHIRNSRCNKEQTPLQYESNLLQDTSRIITTNLSCVHNKTMLLCEGQNNIHNVKKLIVADPFPCKYEDPTSPPHARLSLHGTTRSSYPRPIFILPYSRSSTTCTEDI